MKNYELENVRKFYEELGMSINDIDKLLSNPGTAHICICEIAKFLQQTSSIDPEEFGSTPYENFADRINWEDEESPKTK